MGALIRSIDWSATPLGPAEAWSQSLRIALGICLGSRFPMAIWWGPELRQFYNDGYRPILGDKHPRALGQRGDECWVEIWDVVGPFYEQVMRTGEATFSSDLLLLMERSGYREETYFTFSYSPIRDERGQVGGNLITCSETTERVLGERRLRTLRDLGARAADGQNAADACDVAAATLAANPWDMPFALIYLLDGENRLELAASAGVPAGSGAGPAAVGLEVQNDAWNRCLTEVLQGRGPCAVESLGEWLGAVPPGPWPDPPDAAFVLPLAAPGQERPTGVLVAGVSPRRELDESYLGFLELVAGQIASAIAHARAYEEERRRAETLAELDRAKTVFFNDVSHEFRTPLTLLLGPLEDALIDAGAPLPPEQRERLDTAYRNALRLLKLVNTLLDFSRLEAGRLEAVYQPTDLAALTVELASVFRSAVERAGLRLVVDCPPLGADAYVDHEMWEKIVLNLLSNAFKFTLRGEIAVRLRAAGDHVELAVSDTGAGIPPGELPHVFERFRRVRTAEARSHEGSGIGLALVMELVKLHGGTVRAESAPGEGSTFTVSIPLDAEHLPPERIGAARSLVSTGIGAAPFVEEARRWLSPLAHDAPEIVEHPSPHLDAQTRILLADDNADMRDYVSRLLGERWMVDAVGDGRAALAAARSAPPDLVLADVMMPGLDGFELLRELRSDPATRSLPVILLSARAGEEARVEGLDAGADDYLVKPFSARELVARVGAQLAAAQVRRLADNEREELLARERAARQEAEAANRAKDEFLAMLSHELRNPLGAITNAANTLEDAAGNDHPHLQRLGSIVARQSRHLARLLDDLLDVARVTAGKIELRRGPVDLAEIAEHCRRTLQDSGRADAHRLAVHTSPAWVDGDPARLEQVITNLLENAVKYTPAGGAIRLSVGAENGEAVVRVEDTGMGVAPAMLPRIFELFVQGEQALDRSGGGLGLGLTLVRRLVEMHGGQVEARSAGPGLGSEFSVRLPLRPPATETEEATAAVANDRAGRRVLIIEDNPDSREALSLLLELDGHLVEAAEDGPQGLELAARFNPDLVLLDIGLPGMSGYEVARSLGNHPQRSQMRLIALSGYGQESDRIRSREAGIDVHLVKPVEPARLRELLVTMD